MFAITLIVKRCCTCCNPGSEKKGTCTGSTTLRMLGPDCPNMIENFYVYSCYATGRMYDVYRKFLCVFLLCYTGLSVCMYDRKFLCVFLLCYSKTGLKKIECS